MLLFKGALRSDVPVSFKGLNSLAPSLGRRISIPVPSWPSCGGTKKVIQFISLRPKKDILMSTRLFPPFMLYYSTIDASFAAADTSSSHHRTDARWRKKPEAQSYVGTVLVSRRVSSADGPRSFFFPLSDFGSACSSCIRPSSMSMTATTMKGTQLMAVPIRCRQCLRCSRFKAHDARTLGGVAALSTSAASHKRAQASPLRGPSVSQRIRSQLQQRHPQKQEEPVHQRQPQSKSTQSDSASTSSVERETKVLTLPFSFTTEYARDFAEKMAIPLIYFRGRFFQSALYILSLVFRKVFGRSQRADRIEANVKLKRLSKVYLPYWIVDASVSTRCNGPDGEAETSRKCDFRC